MERPMPQSIPAGLTRTHVLQALADLDAGVDHPFGLPTGYELVHEGKKYPPKAVIGLAFKYALNRVLLPEDFSVVRRYTRRTSAGPGPLPSNLLFKPFDCAKPRIIDPSFAVSLWDERMGAIG
jgi:hypothetical protein